MYIISAMVPMLKLLEYLSIYMLRLEFGSSFLQTHLNLNASFVSDHQFLNQLPKEHNFLNLIKRKSSFNLPYFISALIKIVFTRVRFAILFLK